MATSATANISVNAGATLAADPIGAGTNLSSAVPFAFTLALTSGTTANKIDRVFSKRYSVTSTPTDIDLSGALTDVYGQAVVFVELVAICIKNNSTTAAETLKVGGDAASIPIFGAVADYIIVAPGGCFALINPNDPAIAVTATTGDILQLEAATGTISVDVHILGRSA